MWRLQIGSSVVTTRPRREVSGEWKDWMAVGEEFSEPRTVKRGELVMDQLVELWGPFRFEVVVLFVVILNEVVSSCNPSKYGVG